MEIAILVIIMLAIINVFDAKSLKLKNMLEEEQNEKDPQEDGSLKVKN